MAVQSLGFSLDEIAIHLRNLPAHKAPSKADWARISTIIAGKIDERIAKMQGMRARLGGCIGCGCLSLDVCALYNPDDIKAKDGTGPRALDLA